LHKTTVTKAQKTAGSQRPAPQPKIWTRNYTIMCLATFLYWCSAQMQMPILPKYASLLGVDVQYIGLTSTSFTMVALAMRPFAGRECDRRNRKHVLIAGLFLLVVATSNLFFAGTFALILFLRVLQGAGWAASSTASNTIVADLVPAECRGEGIGYYGLFPTLAMALAPLVGLSLLDSYGFPYVVAVGTVASVLALVTSMFLRLEYTAPPRSGEEVQPVLFDKRAVRPAVIMGILAFSYASD
jgi:MFS family permease